MRTRASSSRESRRAGEHRPRCRWWRPTASGQGDRARQGHTIHPSLRLRGLLAFEPLSVTLDTDIVEVLRLAANQPTTRLIGVVDAEGHLVGMIPIRDLVEAVVARTIPEALIPDAVDVESVGHFGQVVGSHTAADVMIEPVAVTPDATITSALREIHHRRSGAPSSAQGPDRVPDGLELRT
jgi:CBS domain-containing protein